MIYPVSVVLLLACGSPKNPAPETPDPAEPAKTAAPATPAEASAACVELSGEAPAVTSDASERLVIEPKDDAAPLFDQTQLYTYDLTVAPEEMAKLDADPTAEKYVPAKLTWDGVEYAAGLRYKGSVGSWAGCTASTDAQGKPSGAKTCPKLSLKLSFDAYDDDGRFMGLKKLQFTSMNHDPSLMKERLGYWLYREMGVPAPRAVHAKIRINGELVGLFANVEDIDDVYTRSRFADGGEGNLYKERWPSGSSHAPPTTEAYFLEGLKTNKHHDPSVAKIHTFATAVTSSDPNARAGAIAHWLDVPNMLTAFAVDRAIRADDGPLHYYCFPAAGSFECINHNFFFYEETTADRLWMIPWDLDDAFAVQNDQASQIDQFIGIAGDWRDHTVACEAHPGVKGNGSQMSAACDPLINGLDCYYGAHYDQALKAVLEGPFSKASVDEKVAAWKAQIADAVAEVAAADPKQLQVDAWEAALTDFEARTAWLRENAR